MDSGGTQSIKATLEPVTALAGQPDKPWNTPAFQQWMKTVAAMPAEKQVEAVAKKLQELNPGFDGKVTPKIEGGVVTEVEFVTDNVTDISPVRALAGLKKLTCHGSGLGKGILVDLLPLKGMPLTQLDCGWTQGGRPVAARRDVADGPELRPHRGIRLVAASRNAVKKPCNPLLTGCRPVAAQRNAADGTGVRLRPK